MKHVLTLTFFGLIAMLLTTSAIADWFGIGETATAVADMTWKLVAIKAINASQMTILMAIDVVGLVMVQGKFLDLAARTTQDNVLTVPERWLLVGAGATTLITLSLLVPLGYFLITRLFG